MGCSEKSLAVEVRGAAMLQFLLVFLPFSAMFFTLCQLAILEVTSMAVTRSANAAARAAIVALDDDPQRYGGVARGRAEGARLEFIRQAAAFPLLPFQFDREIQTIAARLLSQASLSPEALAIPGLEVEVKGGGSRGSAVQVRVTYHAPCDIPLARVIVCRGATTTFVRETSLPDMAASYEYGQW